MKKTIYILVLSLLIGALPGFARAGEILCNQLEIRNGRIYFEVGTESGVYPHSSYLLLNQSDTIALGHIQWSLEGISVSQPLADSPEPGMVGLTAHLQTADIDSLASITIGTDLGGISLLPDSGLPGNIRIQEYRHFEIMSRDFQAGELDAFVTLNTNGGHIPGASVSESLLPFVATIIPNVSRRCNRGGQLTTSLFYRFDQTRLDLVYNGGCRPANSFIPIDELSRPGIPPPGRSFPYDASRGQTLLANMADRPDSVSIFTASPFLDKLGVFIADILARDRCQISFADSYRDADLYLELIPVSPSIPSVSAYTVFARLEADSTARGGTQALRMLDRRLREVAAANQETQYYRALVRAERGMIEDIGVFPLFQPAVLMVTAKNVKGLRFDTDGLIDLSDTYKLILPTAPSGVKR